IEAPYLADFLDLQMTRADSGAEVRFTDSVGTTTTRLSAQRLNLDRTAHQVRLSGQISARNAAAEVALRTDSMVWLRQEQRLQLPTGSEIDVPSGQVTATWLQGSTDLSEWSLREGTGRFSPDNGGDSVEVSGNWGRLRIVDGNPVVEFDTASARWRGHDVVSDRAVYMGGGGSVRFSGKVTMTDTSRSLAARSLSIRLRERQVVATHVELHDGDLVLRAITLQDSGNGGSWQAQGDPASLRIGEDEVQAQRVRYSAEHGLLQLAHQVEGRRHGRHFSADSLRLDRNSDRVFLEGAVRL
ncbi:uncharacterized protein METZ01_LOCUS379336, partial [marine metagenome]